MASVKYQQGNVQLAEEHLSQYVTRRPGEASATKFLAQIYLSQERAGAAIELLTPMVETAPGDAELLTMLGSAYVKTKDYTKAADVLARAVDIAPGGAAIRTQPAAIHLISGDTDLAGANVEDLFMGFHCGNTPSSCMKNTRPRGRTASTKPNGSRRLKPMPSRLWATNSFRTLRALQSAMRFLRSG